MDSIVTLYAVIIINVEDIAEASAVSRFWARAQAENVGFPADEWRCSVHSLAVPCIAAGWKSFPPRYYALS